MNILKDIELLENKLKGRPDMMEKLEELKNLAKDDDFFQDEKKLELIERYLLDGDINEELIELMKNIKDISHIKQVLQYLWILTNQVEIKDLPYVLGLYTYLIREDNIESEDTSEES